MAKKYYVNQNFGAPVSQAVRPSKESNINDFKNDFMKDRDRVLYSKAFRRIAGKTQIYGTGINDHMRTRLTHTLEVNQIAKTIAEFLRLDVNLTEAIALGHDIGHTPFGHVGERMLHELTTLNEQLDDSMPQRQLDAYGHTLKSDPLRDLYGFKHNWQSAAVALKEETGRETGLNLTNFTLYGMVHHTGGFFKRNEKTGRLMQAYDWLKPYMKLKDGTTDAWSFEAFVVAQADEIAQRHHDLEDAILGRQLTQKKICEEIEKNFAEFMKKRGDVSMAAFQQLKKEENPEIFASRLSDFMLNMLIGRLVNVSAENLKWLVKERGTGREGFMTKSFDMNQYLPVSQADLDSGLLEKIISFDPVDLASGAPSFGKAVKNLEDMVTNNVIFSRDVQSRDAHGSHVVASIFRSYYKTPTQLPDHCIKEFLVAVGDYTEKTIEEKEKAEGIGSLRKEFADRVEKKEFGNRDKMLLIRIICDYIAGMTDAYALKTHQELY